MSALRIGCHVDPTNPIDGALERGAQAIQIFLGDPQKWTKPSVLSEGGAVALREALAQHDIDLYIHAPYVINVASTNNRIRIPSRKLLQQTVELAAECGAKGVVVHGGHITKDDPPDAGFINWRKAVEQLDASVPVLIENTAGGSHATARRLDALGQLWEAVGDSGIGFCLDTCHAHCGGIDLSDAVDRVVAITGRIDLIHANNARDDFDTGRDRHDNLTAGTIDAQSIVEVVRAAGAPVICETPGDAAAQRADIEFLRASA